MSGDRLQSVFIYLALAIILGGFGLGSYWLFWPVNPYVSLSDPGPIIILNDGKMVRTGDPIRYQGGGFHYTHGVQVEVSSELRNGIVIPYPASSYITVAGEWRPPVNTRFVIPEFAPPGKYRLHLFATFHINPLRSITQHRITEEFEVLTKDAPFPTPEGNLK